jgi:hypothetical protein
MRDPRADANLRADIAKAAAPYVHPRLSSIQLKGDDDGSGLTVIIKKFASSWNRVGDLAWF